ncbi:MAG: grasp-with-spasm system ATP-grasp peptide maturase, partial [Saprospiraceae bacterium]|nr:grasp-with-spasm system ATP-grasp peptide maturase [Saprospiraceae bacterium]
HNVQILGYNDCELTLLSEKNGEIRLDKISAIWYRRGEIHFQIPHLNFIKNSDLRSQIFQHLKNENKILQDYLQYLLYVIPHIGTYELRGVNKLVVLDQARKLGIEIPDTFIVSEKKHLESHEKLITKCISEVFSPITDDGKFITYTEAVNPTKRNTAFFPSLFQTLVEKEADIRIFILQDKVYSMAIRSQEHAQTRIDFRKYSSTNPSRYLPFKIPFTLEQKLIELMQRIRLETASIDMVLTKDGKFVFLEANPVGQFGMTSKPCNNYLEREVALSLINLSKQSAA